MLTISGSWSQNPGDTDITVMLCLWATYSHLCAHGRPQAWARGGTCPRSPKCCNVFLCSNSYNKTFGWIIYTLVSQPVVGLASGASPSNPHQRSIPGPCRGNFVPRVPRPLICPPLEKIPRVPMYMPLSSSSIIWYWSKGGDALWLQR